MTRVIFTLTSARSGTLYLRSLFKHNVADCVCRHEPFFDLGNPTLFGRAIYDAYAGRLERIRALLAKKRVYIEALKTGTYIESSHAFLKSAYVAALEFFPDMHLIHLIRHPLKVAKSEAYRQMWRQRLHAPFHFYTGDDRRCHFAWALTGNEPIFRGFDLEHLSLFQWCLIQWIEIENRAMRFLDEHQLHARCVTLHTPRDLNDPPKIKALFETLGLETIYPQIVLRGRKNKSLGTTTVITPQDEGEAEAVLKRVPSQFLEIFARPPYIQSEWSARLRREVSTGDTSKVASGAEVPASQGLIAV
jgi:hypothetical protein